LQHIGGQHAVATGVLAYHLREGVSAIEPVDSHPTHHSPPDSSFGHQPETQGVRVFVLQLIVVRPAAAYIAVKMAKAATELLETRVGILCTPLETNAAAAYFDGLCVDKGLRVAVRCRRRPSCSFRIRSHQPWCCRRAHVLRAGQGFCVRRRRGGGPCLPPERLPPASKC
jgi:hypothetical protein